MLKTVYRQDIQGLRAIAVLAVMIFHLNPVWLPGGFIGVDVFFVISGFLITKIVLNKRTQADYKLSDALIYFYISRFKRIFPAYFFMLVMVAVVAAVFLLPQNFNTFKNGLDKAVWFNSNSYFASFGDYFSLINYEQPLLHTWSLAIEIKFYLIAPFLILLLPIKWVKFFFAVLLVGFMVVAEYRLRVQGIEQATYYSFYARLPEFFAGCLTALHITTVSGSKRTVLLSSIGLVLIILSAIIQPTFGTFPGLAALLPVIGTVLLLVYSTKGYLGQLLCSKPLIWIGALSYSLYLWHWPILAFLRYYTGNEVLSFSFCLLFVFLTLVLTVVSYYWIEKPYRTKRTTKKIYLAWVFLVVSVLGTSQTLAAVNAAFTPEQLPIEYRRYADPDTICHGKIVGNCLQGDLTSDREVLVLGDSHAAMLNHFFDYLGKELNFKARIITASSCVTIPGFDYQRISEWAQQPCLDQIEMARPHIEKSKLIYIAGMWSYQMQSELFNLALNGFLKSYKHKEIIFLSQVPYFDRDVNRNKRFIAIGINSVMMTDPFWQDSNTKLQNVITENYDHAQYLNLSNLPVFDQAPFVGSALIYSDSHHLNQVGATEYAASALPIFYESIRKLQP